MRIANIAIVVFACNLDDGTIECGDGYSCPSGTSCLSEPIGDVHCVSLLCGNGVVDANEQCDGEIAQSCVELGVQYDAGRPTCTSRCTIDTSTCATIGFDPIYEGGAPIGKFCAYEPTPGNVIAHFFQDDRLFVLDGGVAQEMSGVLDMPQDIACVAGKIAAIAQTYTIATYADGDWVEQDVRIGDNRMQWEQITEAGADLTAIGWSALSSGGYGGLIVQAQGLGWNIEHTAGVPLTAIDSRFGQRIVATETGGLLKRGANGTWSTLVATGPFYGIVPSIWITAVDELVASSAIEVRTFRRGAYSAPFPLVEPGLAVGAKQGAFFVASSVGELQHRDQLEMWSSLPSIGVISDIWLASDDTMYIARRAELMRAKSLWLELPVPQRGTTHLVTAVAAKPTLISHRSGIFYRGTTGVTFDGRFSTVTVTDGFGFAAGGGGAPSAGLVARFDVTNPQGLVSKTVPNTLFKAVVAANRDRAWVAGANGHVLAYDNGWAMDPVTAVPGVTLNGIARVPATGELIVVGTNGTIATSLDGNTWTVVPVDVTATLNGVFVRGDEVWVAGDAGTILRRSAGTWTAFPATTPRALYAIGGTDQLFAVGDRTILELVGTQWNPIRPPTTGAKFTTVVQYGPYVYVGSEVASFVLYRP